MPTTCRTLSSIHREHRTVVAIVLLASLLAAVNWTLAPEDGLRWLRAMLGLPLLWFGLTYLQVHARRSERDDALAKERYLLSALSLVVAAVGIVQVTRFGLTIWVRVGDGADLERARRVLGLVGGLVFVVIGNALPKILTPLSVLPLHLAERVTSARRFLGATMVIVGLVVAAAFLTQPLPFAHALVRRATLGVLLTAVGAIVWMNAGPDHDRP